MQFRKATRDDLKEMSQLAATSFADYVIYEQSVKSTFKTKAKYHRFLYEMHYVQFATFLRKGTSLVGTIDDEIVSFALLESPQFKSLTLWDYVWSGGLRLIPYMLKNRLLHFMNKMDKASEKCIDGTPHSWYLSMLAVSKLHQGKQLGTKMIQDCVIPFVKKQGGRRLTLITNNEVNQKFYHKNGFVQFFADKLHFKDGFANNWSFEMDLKS
ncbi:ribosomal protein S18 acetylase RimI-like enzyme [Paenibacillus turicensis]|uniref:Ribosomal protein S18 acetylase RimI-like enzyme n=1 Tax=Paenibacillus turicensis TaxID=160487 RepID=A0ABS4FYN2_9BACL|nr:GNAT family N-acetyltransferase [Paenibacillus turicensis]MBP1907682.1 ribosomal protein S18 acetylase RimI-like enzyme [Paenibacillus turicensis]